MHEFYNWENLANSETFKSIKNDWLDLLNNKTHKERHYHSFLESMPYPFFCLMESYLVISKLKLGSEYETDFVIVKEGYSDGTIYEFVELESPHTKIFDSKGSPTAKFSTALQQILDWKRFLSKEKSFFKKFLPTTTTRIAKDSKVRFKIVIGRRDINAEEIEKRRQYSEQYGVEIVSYDRLTDILSMHRNFFNEPTIFSSEMSFLDNPLKKNNLANPFFKCINDSTWKSMCRKGYSYHFFYHGLDDILANRSYNHYFDDFKKEILGLKNA